MEQINKQNNTRNLLFTKQKKIIIIISVLIMVCVSISLISYIVSEIRIDTNQDLKNTKNENMLLISEKQKVSDSIAKLKDGMDLWQQIYDDHKARINNKVSLNNVNYLLHKIAFDSYVNNFQITINKPNTIQVPGYKSFSIVQIEVDIKFNVLTEGQLRNFFLNINKSFNNFITIIKAMKINKTMNETFLRNNASVDSIADSNFLDVTLKFDFYSIKINNTL